MPKVSTETLLKFLADKDWPLEAVENHFYLEHQGAHGLFPTELHLNEQNHYVYADAFLLETVPIIERPEVAQLMNDVNTEMDFGHFILNMETGVIKARAGIFYGDADFEIAMAVNCLHTATTLIDEIAQELKSFMP